MDTRVEWRSLVALPVMALTLFFSQAKAEQPEAVQTVQAEPSVDTSSVNKTIGTPTASPAPDTQDKIPTTTSEPATQSETSSSSKNPDGWKKLAGNHIEVVYIKPSPHGIDPNITGIDVRVVAQTKELFDYAEGVAMADCDIGEVFPTSGDIYDVNGKTIDPMHIPLLKGMVYIRAFPQEAYDELLERLCAGQPVTEGQGQ